MPHKMAQRREIIQLLRQAATLSKQLDEIDDLIGQFELCWRKEGGYSFKQLIAKYQGRIRALKNAEKRE